MAVNYQVALQVCGGYSWATPAAMIATACTSPAQKFIYSCSRLLSLYQYHTITLDRSYPAIPILCLWWEDIFMSVLKVTNFLSFLCKLEVRAQKGLHSLYSIPDLAASLYLYPQAHLLHPKLLTLLPLLHQIRWWWYNWIFCHIKPLPVGLDGFN